ncbi:MAG TPA: roadblock/LC7 domain-containing protein [Pseudonocardiaceae bacterium]|nr:roadblock/LC7 domain-containing protein [Pseudonocardiaceae bacterium]
MNPLRAGSGARDLDWLLNDLIGRMPGATGVALLSADGLLISRSSSLSRDNGDHLAAVASAFQSLAKGAGQQFGGGAARQTIVELETAFLVITSAGRSACLALLTTVDIDLELAAYELKLLVKQVGIYLSARMRSL